MGFTDQAATAKNAAFQDKMRIALCAAASEVIAEAATAHNIVDEKRHKLALDIINEGAESKLVAFSWVAASLGLNESTADADLKAGILAWWNNLSGVTSGEING